MFWLPSAGIQVREANATRLREIRNFIAAMVTIIKIDTERWNYGP
jgi:hypothetical protein